MGTAPSVQVEKQGAITIITLNRPARKNAVDGPTARALAQAFQEFDRDPKARVAVLTGAGGDFCSGADLKAIAGEGEPNPVSEEGIGPMGPTRMLLSKPVVAAISGYAVAGGLELALWCDLRVADETAIFGVFCRRWGVPLIDGGTVRLPRLIGLSRALDLILTGREVSAREALAIGLIHRLVPAGQALPEAVRLAEELSRFPQTCLREDRLSAYEQATLPLEEALRNEFRHGQKALTDPDFLSRVRRFLRKEPPPAE